MTTQLVRTTIADGVSLSVLQDRKFKHNRLSVNLIVPLDERTVTGYAILPLLLRKGCKSCPDFTELNRRLDALYGASLIAEVGKCGANQIITLGISAVDDRFTMNGEQLVQECAALLRDLLMEPLITDGAFPQADVELEKQNLIDAIEAEINDKRSYAVAQCRVLMGRGRDPAALRKYGTTAAAREITPQSAAESYYALLDAASIEIIFVGSGDVSHASEIMKKAFAGLRRHPAGFTASPARQPEAVAEKVEHLEVAQSKMVLGFRLDGPNTTETQAALRLMIALYGGTPSSKLFLNVREKLSLCYYCAARYDRMGGLMLVDCGVEQQNIERAKEEILRQLEDLKNGIFEDETLENTRLMLKNSLRSVGDFTSSLEDWYLNRIISGNVFSPEQELELLDSVTRRQVIDAAGGISLDAVYLLTAKEE